MILASNLKERILTEMMVKPIPFSKFDWAQPVNAMMRAKDKTNFWKNMLKEWANTAWSTREDDVKSVVQSAWKYGNTHTANIIAERKGDTVVLNVYVKISTPIIEKTFTILMKEAS